MHYHFNAHGYRCREFDAAGEDEAVSVGASEVVGTGLPQELRDLWLPLKSCDLLVVRYRKWLDRHAPPGQPYRGFATHAAAIEPGTAGRRRRRAPYTLHTRQCATCTRAYQRARRLRRLLIAALALLLPVVMMASTDAARALAESGRPLPDWLRRLPPPKWGCRSAARRAQFNDTHAASYRAAATGR